MESPLNPTFMIQISMAGMQRQKAPRRRIVKGMYVDA